MDATRSTDLMDSPFREHFDTNYIPSDAEIERIRAHLVPHEGELTRLESLIHVLIAQRDQIRDYIKPHRALISHPRRMPREIVEEIFHHCVPIRHNAVMRSAEAPLLLGRICSSWRSITFSTPRLWASLHIPTNFIGHSGERKAALVDWLERSAQLPLSLSVICFWDDFPELNPLLQVSTRWHSLDIYISRSKNLLQLAAVDAPMLRNLQIIFPHGFETPQDAPQVLSSNLIRRMKSGRVTIVASELNALVPKEPFAWDHLTDLSLKGQYSHIFLESGTAYKLLKGCPHLMSLKVHIRCSVGDHKLLLLPALESLIIADSSPTDALQSFFKQLIMPALTRFHLTIHYSSPASALPPAFFERLAERSPLISDLDIDVFDSMRNSIVPTLQLFPRLAILKLAARYVHCSDAEQHLLEPNAAKLLAFLAPDTSGRSPCSELKSVIVESHSVDTDVLVDFLQKQLDCGTNLRRFELHSRTVLPHILPDIKFAADRGLVVALKYKPVDKGPKSTPWEGIQR
ncbi:hypothetical protein MVEN_00851600 [Mycena venus]|uniref:F-box domain-containing protein n=1 Tax=Mycena venus TaxID=2733690 RepID=A0A8H7D116_9AGAR|nr:hypothetical protein MVEN_00851600 [Mycena venus]